MSTRDQAELALHKRKFMQYVDSVLTVNSTWAYIHGAAALLSVLADEPVFRSALEREDLPALTRARARQRHLADMLLLDNGQVVELTGADLAAAEYLPGTPSVTPEDLP